MSVSDADRRHDKQRTLCQILAAVGDRYLIEVAVAPADKEFEDVLSTTWRELLDDGLVDDEFSSFWKPRIPFDSRRMAARDAGERHRGHS
jgi:hypothetical protein